MDNMILIVISVYIVTILIVITILNLIQGKKNKRIKKELRELEIEKNKIDSTPIMPELAKVEGFAKNEKLEIAYNEWKERLDDIKETQIPRITDMLIDADYSLSQMDYKTTMYKIAKLEMELYKARTNSEFLLNEIKDITSSEEKNRAEITTLKTKYRKLYEKFIKSKDEFGEIEDSVSLQFENIAKKFEEFESVMEQNNYMEVAPITKAIDEMLKHMEVVVEEVPAIVVLATNVLPTKIKEITTEYNDMVALGYQLDYLNIEYNIEEANKKINGIMDRCKVLNLEDSLFELKVLLDYFESLFGDFEKEKVNRSVYEDANNAFKTKLDKINGLLDNIFSQLDEVKSIYNLSQDDLNLLSKIKSEMDSLNDDYKVLMDHTSNHAFAYSKLTAEVENLVVRLNGIESELDISLDSIGNMKDDEVRARQQLEEVKLILKDARSKIRDYNLPVIPDSYFVELKEAQDAIKEIVVELNRKPITISTLNTRVDTARDLVLKLLGKTNEMMKTAMFSEMAIVYGNRFRTDDSTIDKNLTAAEILFYKGDYKKSLEISINALNKVEPGLYDKLLEFYGNQ
jgi:septation ring formation regulator